MKRIAILALQGAFAEHEQMLTMLKDCGEERTFAYIREHILGK